MNLGQQAGFNFLPPVVKNLIIVNVIVFVATTWLIPSVAPYLSLYHWDSPLYRPWQIVTHMFMHGGIAHLFFNMFALWMFGSSVESRLGSQRFLTFYFICGFGAALLHLLVFTWENQELIHLFKQLSETDQINAVNTLIAYRGSGGDPELLIGSNIEAVTSAAPMVTQMVGASGAIYGVLFAFGYLFPNLQIMIYFLFPVKAKYFVAIIAAIALFSGIQNSPTDDIAHFAHLGGMLFAFILLRYWKIHMSGFNRWN